MRLREHEGIIPGRIDILYCRPDALAVEEGYNVRDMTTAEARADLDELKAQIKAQGILTPLKVRFDGKDIILVEGHRRRVVTLELIAEHEASGGTEGRNIEAVPIFPEPPGTTVEDRDAGLELSNSGTRLKPLERANLIYRMHTVRGLPLEEVAKRLGMTMPVLKNHLAMRAMPEPVKQQVRDGDVSATLAAKLVKEEPEKAAELIRANQEENKRLGVGKRAKVTAKTLKRDAKPKADKIGIPARAPRGQTPVAPAESAGTAEPASSVAPELASSVATERAVESIDAYVAELAHMPSDHPLHPASRLASAREQLGLTPTPTPTPTRYGVLKDLIEALQPFAALANDIDLNARDDDELELVEVRILNLKRAAIVYARATGGEG